MCSSTRSRQWTCWRCCRDVSHRRSLIIPKRFAYLSLIVGLCFLAYAFVAGLPKGQTTPPLAPAAFVEIRWQGPTPGLPTVPHYAPSLQITEAAVLRHSGAWPLDRTWYELPPPELPPEAVVVLLHGSGRDGLSMLEMWQETGRKHGLLLVAPNGGAWRHSALGRRAVRASAVAAALAYGLDPTGLFLFGHSDGAGIAQTLVAEAPPGQWRAAAVHAGYMPPQPIGPGRSAAALRIYLGDKDHIFALGPARQSARAMAASGHPTELVVIPGHTHWFYDIGPQIAEDAWAWFATSGR